MPNEPHHVDVVVGNRIRSIRKALQMSQTDVARVCGISFQQIQKYEEAKNRVSCSRLVQIAHALQVNPGQLLEDISYEPS